MGLFDFLDPIQDKITKWLIETGYTIPPSSTVLLLFVSLIVSTVSGLVNRALIDMEKLGKKTEEMQEHQKKKKKAMETADKKLWAVVKRNEERFLTLQRETMTARMLPSFITIGPFIFIFQTLRGAFQEIENESLNGDCRGSCGVVAILPFKMTSFPYLGEKWFSPYIHDGGISVAGFGFWYFLSAVVISTLIQRLFGINLTGMQNPMQQQR